MNFAFRSSEVRYIVLEYAHYGGTDPLGTFPHLIKRTADVLAPCLSVVYRRLLRLDSFLALLQIGLCHPIPKGPPSITIANYLPISISSLLFNVSESLVSVGVGRFVESSGVLPTAQFSYWKGLGPVMYFCVCPIH